MKFFALLTIIFLMHASVQGSQWVDLRGKTSSQPTDKSNTASVEVVTNAPGNLQMTMTMNGFWKSDLIPPPDEAPTSGPQQFDEIHIPGWTHMQTISLPAVPVKRILLPVDTDQLPNVLVTHRTPVPIDPIIIAPAQPPFLDVSPEPPRPAFTIDEEFYQRSDLYPANNLITTRMVKLRNQNILEIELAAIRFRPSTGEAEALTDMQISITYDTEAPTETTSSIDAATNLPIYMILMDDQFATNTTLTSFIDWKKRKGCDVRIVKTSQINANGAPTNTEIVAYMRELSNENYPDYLLIIGDQTAKNGVAARYFTTDTGGYTDLDITCRTTSDFLPDLYCGRMPASNNVNASLMLEKALFADRTPPSSGMFTNTIVAGQIQDGTQNEVADRLFCETADVIASYFEQHSSPRYACTRAMVNPNEVTAACVWNPSSILWANDTPIGTRIFNHFVGDSTAQGRFNSTLNKGAALIFHRDHGYSSGVGWESPYIIYYHVNILTNGNNRAAVFSINCNSGSYQRRNNFARCWLIHTNGGGYAVFAPVDASYSWFNDWLSHGFMTAFCPDYIHFQNTCTAPDWSNDLPNPGGAYGTAGSAQRLGQILNFGKMYLREHFSAHEETFELFHLFGDPESYLHTKNPTTISASHASEIDGGEQTITINTGINDATVCLYAEGLGIHQIAQTVNGSATFTVNASKSGNIAVTITKAGYRPYEGTITVGTPFSCKAFAMTNNVLLRWSAPMLCGFECNTVKVNYTTSGYPTHPGAGSTAYTGTNTSYRHSGLTPGQAYYYSIWLTDGGGWTNPPQ